MKLLRNEIKTVQVSLKTLKSKDSIMFISSLLHHNIEERLGFTEDIEIRSVKFFKSINWEKMLRLELPPAFVPGRINVAEKDREEAMDVYRELTNDNINEQKCLYDTSVGKEVVTLSLGLRDAAGCLL
jgi:hypothetical protein